MAVLFAKAMGCAVTVLLRDSKFAEGKVGDAFALGAEEVVPLHDPDTVYIRDADNTPTPLKKSGTADSSPINILLICATETPDFETVLPLLARRAVIVLMSIQNKPLEIPYMSFILPGHRIIASTEASTRNHTDMIQFAARHGIQPWVERFPMTEEGLREAFGKLERGEMRFRGVVEVPV